MKKVLIGTILMLTASFGFAAAKTEMGNNWVCTTNASSADTDADKAADNQMANKANSATSSFGFAAQNCRDCTKITCNVNN